jgi:hypothetical protein
MLVFLDTEFTDFVQIDLISIALVSEDGRELYVERIDYRAEDCSDFVRAEVLPMLGRVPGARCDLQELTRRLRAWFDALPEAATVVFDYSKDWDLLVDALLGDEYDTVPPNVATRLHLAHDTLSDAAFKMANVRSFTHEWPPHHALADARALRAGYRAHCIKQGLPVWGRDSKLAVLVQEEAMLVARLDDGREFRSRDMRALAGDLTDAGISAEDVRGYRGASESDIPTRKHMVALIESLRRRELRHSASAGEPKATFAREFGNSREIL